MRWTTILSAGTLATLIALHGGRTGQAARVLRAPVADGRRPLIAIHVESCGSPADDARAAVAWFEHSMEGSAAPLDLSFEFAAPDLVIVATSWQGEAASLIQAAETGGAPPVPLTLGPWDEGGETCSGAL
jgi:hypothetical protein